MPTNAKEQAAARAARIEAARAARLAAHSPASHGGVKSKPRKRAPGK